MFGCRNVDPTVCHRMILHLVHFACQDVSEASSRGSWPNPAGMGGRRASLTCAVDPEETDLSLFFSPVEDNQI